jgi:hypothetical protein
VRRRSEDVTDVAPDGCLDLDDLLAGFAILLVVVLLVVILLPLLLVVVELAVLTLLTVLGLVARVVFRRPWVVEATDSGPFRHTWRIVGWRASREFVDGVAAGLAHGNGLPAGAQRVQRPGDGAAGAAPTDAPT